MPLWLAVLIIFAGFVGICIFVGWLVARAAREADPVQDNPHRLTQGDNLPRPLRVGPFPDFAEAWQIHGAANDTKG